VTRIVAGTLGGRRLTVPSDARVRPTADRVREAWFSILGGTVLGARVLDLCAGSGALGIEAVSRGAAAATLVEINPKSLAAIRANIDTLGVADRVRVVRQDAVRFVEKLEPMAFDLVLADPPYGIGVAERLVERFRAAPFAPIFAIEHRAADPIEGDDTRTYGDTAVTFLRAP